MPAIDRRPGYFHSVFRIDIHLCVKLAYDNDVLAAFKRETRLALSADYMTSNCYDDVALCSRRKCPMSRDSWLRPTAFRRGGKC